MSCNCSVTISFCSFIITTAVCLKLIQDTNPLAVRSALAVLAMRPDLHKLPACLRTYLEQQGAKSEAGNSDLANTYLVFSAVITSRLPWEADWRMCTPWRQCAQIPSFMGSPSMIVSALTAEVRRRGMANLWPCSVTQPSPWPLCATSLLLHRCPLSGSQLQAC